MRDFCFLPTPAMLSGAKEWYDRAKGMADGHSEAVAEVLMDHYKDWYREVMDKVIRFDMH